MHSVQTHDFLSKALCCDFSYLHYSHFNIVKKSEYKNTTRPQASGHYH